MESLWLNATAAAVRFARTARRILWTQRRNRAARRSHIKTRREKLRALGIDLLSIQRCQWPAPSS